MTIFLLLFLIDMSTSYHEQHHTTDTAGAVNLISAGWRAEGFFTDAIDTACQGNDGIVYFFCKDEYITYDIAGRPLPNKTTIT